MVTMRPWILPLLVVLYTVNSETIRRERKRDRGKKHESIQLRTRWFLHSEQEAKASAAGLDTEDEAVMLQFEAMIEENMSIATTSPSAAVIAPSAPTRMSSFPTTMPSEGGMTPSPTKSQPEVPISPTVQPSDSPSVSPSEGVVDGAPTGAPDIFPTGAPSIRGSGTPNLSPSDSPTEVPTVSPSMTPTSSPTVPCNMSPQNRADRMLALINVISRPADVTSSGTPQSKAANWIINGDEAKLCPQDNSWIQRYVLALFYFSTNGDRWFQCQSPADSGLSVVEANAACNLTTSAEGTNAWLTPESECQWAGITCDENENIVQELAIESNGVSGTLPFEVRSLQSLVTLSLERGIITGTIPEGIGFIKTLETLDLDNNLLEGTIPLSIYRLTNLQQLDLDKNEFSSTISPLIQRMTNLRLLQINNNGFSGTIPTEIGKLTNLRVATFERNQFQGRMPDEVCANTGVLGTLTSDCLGAPNRPSPPFVDCSCCSGCF